MVLIRQRAQNLCDCAAIFSRTITQLNRKFEQSFWFSMPDEYSIFDVN